MKHISKLTYLLGLPALIGLSLLYSMNVALGDISISIPSSMDLHRPQLWKLVLGSTGTPTVVEVKTGKNVLSIRNGLVMGLDNASLSGAKYVSIGGGINNVISSIESSGIGGGKGNFIDSPVSVIGGGAENVVKSSSKYSTVAGGHSNVVDFEGSIVGGENNVVIGRSVVVGGRDNYVEGEGSMVLGSSSQGGAKSFSWNSPIVRDYSAIIVANAGVLIGTYYPVTGVNLVVEGAVKIGNGSLTGNIGEIRLQSGCFYGYDGSDWHVVNKKPGEGCPKVTCTYGSLSLHPGDSVQAYTQPYSTDCSQTLRTANCYEDGTFGEPGVQYYAYCYDLSGGIWHDEEVAACGAADGKVYVNSPTPSDGLCENGDSGEIDTQNTLFAWQCSIGTSVANCSATRVYSCEGDQPTGPGLIMGDTTQMYSDTLKSWTPVAQGVLPGTCQWTCAEGYEQQANGCSGDIIIESSECGTYNASDFEDLDMYFLTDEGTTGHYTLMDRNLGATQVYTGTDNICTYGYYYQWGNNYGFANEGPIKTSTERVDTSSYGPDKYYSSDTFIKSSYDWSINQNDNLWGGYGSVTDRRGPCPIDYHIPSSSEFRNIVDNYWKESVSEIRGSQFALDFLIPIAGYRNTYSNVVGQTLTGTIWYSNRSNHTSGASVHLWFHLNSSNIIVAHSSRRTIALPVRCAKNTPNSILTIHPDGGTGAIIIVHGGEITKLGTPSKGSEIFEGWYSDSSFTPDSQVRTGDTVLAGTHLYAKWESSEGCTEAQDITICNPENSSECLTIMDRNLGACVAGTGEESYGNYYQWGNNYGFHYSLGNTIPIDNNGLIWDDSYNNKGYVSESLINGKFFDYDVWSNSGHHDGVWGGADDNESNGRGVTLNNSIERQGPCPVDYHVPSAGEWSLLIKYRRDTYATGVTLGKTFNLYRFNDSTAQTNFQTFFKLPFAGTRDYVDASISGQEEVGAYWSSSTVSSSYTLEELIRARIMFMNSPNVYANGNYWRAYGVPVRCFKNN